MPPAALRSFGVHSDGELVGAVVVTAGARHAHRLLVGANPGSVATVARVWLADEVPKNAESRVLGVVARLLRRSSGIRALMSYADPAAGHVGTIYMASGWRYLGQSEPGRYLDLGDGQLHHPRSVSTRFGTNSPSVLRKQGIPAKSVLVGGKHRYCLVLDLTWTWRLIGSPQPYPRRTPIPAAGWVRR